MLSLGLRACRARLSGIVHRVRVRVQEHKKPTAGCDAAVGYAKSQIIRTNDAARDERNGDSIIAENEKGGPHRVRLVIRSPPVGLLCHAVEEFALRRAVAFHRLECRDPMRRSVAGCEYGFGVDARQIDVEGNAAS